MPSSASANEPIARHQQRIEQKAVHAPPLLRDKIMAANRRRADCRQCLAQVMKPPRRYGLPISFRHQAIKLVLALGITAQPCAPKMSGKLAHTWASLRLWPSRPVRPPQGRSAECCWARRFLCDFPAKARDLVPSPPGGDEQLGDQFKTAVASGGPLPRPGGVPHRSATFLWV